MSEKPWQELCNDVRTRSTYLLESAKWSDCQLILWQGDKRTTFDVHKMILSMASPVFAAYFFNSQSVDANASVSMRLVLKDIEPDAITRILRYIYTDEIQLNSVDESCALGRAAYKYELGRLVDACIKYVKDQLKPENACRILEFSNIIKNDNLSNKSLKYICANTSQVLTHRSFADVDTDTLITICQQEDLNIEDEIELFNAVVSYNDAMKEKEDFDESKSSMIMSAVQNIRYLNMSIETFRQGPAKSSLLNDDQIKLIMAKLENTDENIKMPDGFTSANVKRNKIEIDDSVGDNYREGDELQNTEKELRSSLAECERLRKRTESQLYKEKQSNNDITNKFKERERENKKLQTKLEDLNKELTELNRELNRKNNEIVQLEDHITSVIDRLQPLYSKLQNKNAELLSIKKMYEESIVKSNKELQLENSENISTEESISTDDIKLKRNLEYNCERIISQVTNQHGAYFCRLTFKVDASVMLLGIRLPAQVQTNTEALVYDESLQIDLVDLWKRKNILSLSKQFRVHYNETFIVKFDQGITIEANQVYNIRVKFKNRGLYPLADTTQMEKQLVGDINVHWQINQWDNNSGLIRALLFKKISSHRNTVMF